MLVCYYLEIGTIDALWFLHCTHVRLHLVLQGGRGDRNQGDNLRTQHQQGQLLVVLGAKIENFLEAWSTLDNMMESFGLTGH